MADENDFGENPFRNLDLVRFPKTCVQADPTGIAPEDRALFLTAWNRMPEAQIKKKGSGFVFADICALPPVVMKKAKKPVHVPVKPPLEAEDEFLVAMRNTTPLSGQGRAIAPKPKLKPTASLKEATLADFMAGKLEFAVSFSNEYLEGHVVGLDELIMSRLREGQLSVEANLDLHGLNASQAFEALKVFIRNAWLKDLRSVLVVTGRGRNSPDGQAVLRQKLQTWLTKEPFKRVVLAFCTAKPHDGGPGSIYVLLRRFRKKGPIFWERLFVEDEDM